MRQAVEDAFVNAQVPLPREIVNTTSLLVMIAIGAGLYFLGYHLLFTGVASAEWQLVAALAFGVVTVYVFALLNRGMKLNLISRLAQEVIIVMVEGRAKIGGAPMA